MQDRFLRGIHTTEHMGCIAYENQTIKYVSNKTMLLFSNNLSMPITARKIDNETFYSDFTETFSKRLAMT